MNPLHAAICVPLGVLAYWLVGLGPALALLRGGNRWCHAVLLAGPVGMAVTSLVGTCLVRMDLPVRTWAWPWLVLMVLAGAGYASWSARSPGTNEVAKGTADKRWCIAFFIATLLACVLLVAPATIGGVRFTALRFNRWDAQNYLGMARYLDHWPLSWIQTATDSQCVEADAMFLHIRAVLSGRYTTSILLAWVANLANGPLARFEYTHCLIYPVLTIGPAMLLAHRSGLRLWHAALLGLAVATGFWGVYVVDARACSQANSIALLPLIAVAAVLLHERTSEPGALWRSVVLLAIALGSLVPVYLESMPLALTGTGLFSLLIARQRRECRSLLSFTVAAVIAVVLGCLAWPTALKFLKYQTGNAMGAQVTWHMDFFPWLFTHPWKDLFIGPWGLGLLTPNNERVGIVDTVLFTVAILLLLVYGWSVFQSLRRRTSANTASVIVHAFAIMALTQWVALTLKGQLWAGAKGLGFGYMFFLMGLATALASREQSDESSDVRSRLPRGAAWFVVAFLVVQALVVPAIRVSFAVRDREPANYIDVGQRFMRTADFSTAPFEPVLAAEPEAGLGVAINDVWITSYFMTALGDRRQVFDFVGVRDRDIDDSHRTILGRQPMIDPPKYLVVMRDSALRKYLRDAEVAAESGSFTLLRRRGPQWGDSLTVLQTSLAPQNDPEGRPRYHIGKEPLKISLANLGNQPQPATVSAEVEFDDPPASPMGLAIKLDQQEAVARIGPDNQWSARGTLVFPQGIQSLSLELRPALTGDETPGSASPNAAWLRLRIEPLTPTPATKP